MKEKRISKRSAIELAASFGIGEDPRPEREAKISDISEGGFCFISDSRPKVGAARPGAAGPGGRGERGGGGAAGFWPQTTSTLTTTCSRTSRSTAT